MSIEYKDISHKDKAQLIIDLISSLIISHAGMLASEQQRFENLVTGVVT